MEFSLGVAQTTAQRRECTVCSCCFAVRLQEKLHRYQRWPESPHQPIEKISPAELLDLTCRLDQKLH